MSDILIRLRTPLLHLSASILKLKLGVAMGEEKYWRVKRKTVSDTIIAFVVLLLIYAVIKPVYSDYSDRIVMTEILEKLTQTRVETESTLVKQNLVDAKNITLLHPDIKYGQISTNGAITIYSPKVNTFVVLTPNINKGVVTWHCFADPEINVSPEFCMKK